MAGAHGTNSKLLRSHTDLDVYNMAFEAAMTLFAQSKSFPREEVYSLTSQVRRSSRSVATNIIEAWRKRRYEAAFISKLSDAEAEAAETQGWIQFAVRSEYLGRGDGVKLYRTYERIIGALVKMQNQSARWALPLDRERVPRKSS